MRICPSTYDTELHFELVRKYSFELDHFQKYAIEAIHTERNVLVTAHTGSGKTLPAEYAIEYFVSRGKRVIYTSPIKSLSNQKFHDFTQEFETRDTPITIGILTGDIKFNPDADVLIMTTEILRNKLVQGLGDFEMDNVSCIVYDEIHYINDEDRGKVWEEAIMYTPRDTQLILLSATIDRENEFAEWIETATERETWLASTKKRVVPLNHLMWSTLPSSTLKTIDTRTLSPIQMIAYKNILKEQPFPLTKENISAYHSFMYKARVRNYKNKSVLNDVVRYLDTNKMLPAITFVFSRRMCEVYANSIELNLGEQNVEMAEGGRRPKVEQQVRYILSTKFTNYREYLELPECIQLISLANRGIGFHHSGVVPILREVVEILFAKGYIKLLFATETFAVGINMPTKTVLMTGLSKMSSKGHRNLYSHEYTQMAGRAGRRGIDTVGYVIHLPAMMRDGPPQTDDYMRLLSGRPQTLRSKYVVTPLMVLSMYRDDDGIPKTSKTMMMDELRDEIAKQTKIVQTKKTEWENVESKWNIDCEGVKQIDEYINMERSLTFMKPKKKKSVRTKMNAIKTSIPNFDEVIRLYKQRTVLNQKYCDEKNVLENMNNYVNTQVERMNVFLENIDAIERGEDGVSFVLTKSGREISQLNNYAFVLYDCMVSQEFKGVEDWLNVLSVCSGMKQENGIDYPMYDVEKRVHTIRVRYENMYQQYRFQTIDYLMNQLEEKYSYGIGRFMVRWYFAPDEASCRAILKELCSERGVLLGDFVKGVLKMVQLARELGEIAHTREDIELFHMFTEIQEGLMKYVVTNQSLYI